jgi:hypothetical protein
VIHTPLDTKGVWNLVLRNSEAESNARLEDPASHLSGKGSKIGVRRVNSRNGRACVIYSGARGVERSRRLGMVEYVCRIDADRHAFGLADFD